MATIIQDTPVKVTKKSDLPFSKKNYTLMLIGIALILVGFLIMSLEEGTYGFGTLALTVAPILILAGFVVEFFAILKKPSKD